MAAVTKPRNRDMSRLSRHSVTGGAPLGGIPPVTNLVAADELKRLARRIRQLSPDTRNPEAFHIEKDEIAHAVGILAKGLGHG